MLKLPEGVRIWVATAPCDMRKQANGLSALVQGSPMQQPESGHLFGVSLRGPERRARPPPGPSVEHP